MLVITRGNHRVVHIGAMRVSIYCINENYIRLMIGNQTYKIGLGHWIIVNGARIKYLEFLDRYRSARLGIAAPPDVLILREELLAS